MSRVKITVDMLEESRPVARKNLMLLDLTCDMTESQMFQAIQSMRESCSSATWGRWMEQWGDGEELFPYQAKTD